MEKRRAFVTGVSSGLGEAFATELISQGYEVYGMSRTKPSDLLQGGGFYFESCDLSQLDGIRAHANSLLQDAPSIDLVFLASGIIGDLKPLTEVTMPEIQQSMNVNVWSNKFLIDYLLTSGKNPKQVIGVSSGASLKGSKGWAGYSLSKATLNMLLKIYANENPNSHFTSLAPGLVQTNMLKRLLSRDDIEEFPSLQHLHDGYKFTPREAARLIFQNLDHLMSQASGSYVDMRDLVGKKSF